MKVNKLYLNKNDTSFIDNKLNTIYSYMLSDKISTTGRIINGRVLYGIYLWKIL
jgi:hypothetical protein